VRLPIIEKISKNIAETLYAIDDATAIVVDGNNISIVSEGEWRRFK